MLGVMHGRLASLRDRNRMGTEGYLECHIMGWQVCKIEKRMGTEGYLECHIMGWQVC